MATALPANQICCSLPPSGSSQLGRNTRLFQPSLSTPHVGLHCRPSSYLVRIGQAVRSGVFRSLNSSETCHSDCVAGATAGWSRRADYEQPAGELAWHELGDLVQALRPVTVSGEWERQLLSFPHACVAAFTPTRRSSRSGDEAVGCLGGCSNRSLGRSSRNSSKIQRLG